MPATELTKEQILDILRPVQDPTLNQSIVDLGMVRDPMLEGDTLAMELELLTPLHPHREQIEAGIRAAVAGAGIGAASIV